MEIGSLVTLDTAARKLGKSYYHVYRRVKKERIPTIRVGKSLLVDFPTLKQTNNK